MLVFFHFLFIFLKCVSSRVSFSFWRIWSWRFSFLRLKLFERIQKCEGSWETFLAFKSFTHRTCSLRFYWVFNDCCCSLINDFLLLLYFVSYKFLRYFWNSKIRKWEVNFLRFHLVKKRKYFVFFVLIFFCFCNWLCIWSL